MRKCSKCKLEKPLTEFHRRNAKWFSSHCKPCRSAERKSKYAEDPSPVKERSRNWRQANPEKAREASSRVKEKNKEKISAQQKAWRAANIERLLMESRATYAANREEMAEKSRAWRVSNLGKVAAAKLKHYHAVQKHKPEFKAAEAARRALKRTLNRTGQDKSKRTTSALGYDFERLRSHLEKNFSEGMSWDNYGEWHVDHVIPIAEMIRLGVTCPKTINALKNLMPRWAGENISKGDRFELAMQPAM
jgi:hypothetical protein